jgi:hypothetical protein
MALRHAVMQQRTAANRITSKSPNLKTVLKYGRNIE